MTDLDRLDALAAADDLERIAKHISTRMYFTEPITPPHAEDIRHDDYDRLNEVAATIRSLLAAVRERDELRAAAGAVMLALEPEVLPRTLNRKIPVLQYDSASIARLRAALHREDGT